MQFVDALARHYNLVVERMWLWHSECALDGSQIFWTVLGKHEAISKLLKPMKLIVNTNDLLLSSSLSSYTAVVTRTVTALAAEFDGHFMCFGNLAKVSDLS